MTVAYEMVQVQLGHETCCQCGMLFGMPREVQERRRRDQAVFYCPAGHPQHYTGKTEAQKLQEELDREKKRREWAESDARGERARADRIDRSREAYKGHLTRIRKRVSAGVCPCCKRTFEQLAAHMKTKHPDYGKESS